MTNPLQKTEKPLAPVLGNATKSGNATKNATKKPKSKSQMERAVNMVEKTSKISEETFNLIARSLLNVSDEVPKLVRDCADIRSDNTEIKSMVWELGRSIASLSNDISTIAKAVGVSIQPSSPQFINTTPMKEMLARIPSIEGGNE